MNATAAELTWVEQSRGFYRSKGGRFDLWFTGYGNYFVAIDWNCGVKHVAPDREECEDWCRNRLEARP